MAERLIVKTERVDDIPVLLAQAERMGLPELVDEHFVPHGNWLRISVGMTTTIWLTDTLSEGDHRPSRDEDWVAHRMETLFIAAGHPVHSLDRIGKLSLGLEAFYSIPPPVRVEDTDGHCWPASCLFAALHRQSLHSASLAFSCHRQDLVCRAN